MRKQDFTIHWSMLPDWVDWSNLNLSGCKRVMLPFLMANTHRDVLAHLASLQCRVVLRVEEDAVYATDAPRRVYDALRGMLAIVAVDAVILGCEPENPYNFEFGADNWGQAWAEKHVRTVNNVYRALAPIQGVDIVAPGWTMRSISEDEKPQPGKVTWREICAPVYNALDGAGCHIYQYGWESMVDELRFKFALKEAQQLAHVPIWIDEVNIARGSQLERMRACIAMANLLLTHPLGERVKMFSPFVSAGNGVGWDAGLLMRDPACYQALGAWMRS